jgi:prefoldin subunit 5
MGDELQPTELEIGLAKVQHLCGVFADVIDAQKADIERLNKTISQVKSFMVDVQNFMDRTDAKLSHISHQSGVAGGSGASTEEIEMLSRNITSIRKKANEVDDLKDELVLLKSRLKKLEEVSVGGFSEYEITFRAS